MRASRTRVHPQRSREVWKLEEIVDDSGNISSDGRYQGGFGKGRTVRKGMTGTRSYRSSSNNKTQSPDKEDPWRRCMHCRCNSDGNFLGSGRCLALGFSDEVAPPPFSCPLPWRFGLGRFFLRPWVLIWALNFELQERWSTTDCCRPLVLQLACSPIDAWLQQYLGWINQSKLLPSSTNGGCSERNYQGTWRIERN